MLSPELLGLAGSERWGEATQQSFQEWVLALETARCTFRHGFLPTAVHGGDPYYLLDMDCYVEETQPFDVDEQVAHLDRFNDVAYDLFRGSLSDTLYESFEPEGDTDE